MTEPAVCFRGVSKVFARRAIGRRSCLAAVSDLSFTADRGEHVAIIGRTGCGKSTTVNLLLGLAVPTAGSVQVLGHDPHREFQALRGRVGCIFQGDRLLPWRTVLDNVMLPLAIEGTPREAGRAAAGEWLDRVDLGAFMHAFPHELSGGMRQRVALARALVSAPDLIVADEAFGHLDEATAQGLRGELKRIARERGATVLQITHSLDEALAMADRVLVFGRPGHVIGNFPVDREAAGGLRPDLRAGLLALLEASTAGAGPSVAAA